MASSLLIYASSRPITLPFKNAHAVARRNMTLVSATHPTSAIVSAIRAHLPRTQSMANAGFARPSWRGIGNCVRYRDLGVREPTQGRCIGRSPSVRSATCARECRLHAWRSSRSDHGLDPFLGPRPAYPDVRFKTEASSAGRRALPELSPCTLPTTHCWSGRRSFGFRSALGVNRIHGSMGLCREGEKHKCLHARSRLAKMAHRHAPTKRRHKPTSTGVRKGRQQCIRFYFKAPALTWHGLLLFSNEAIMWQRFVSNCDVGWLYRVIPQLRKR